MSDVAIESDPLFTLLTDALRAGPGSPQWSQAVAELRHRGAAGDEYAMLIEARKNLESGRDYRSVRAGPGFTRKLLRSVEEIEQPSGTGGVPTTTIVAGLSAVVIVLLIGFAAYALRPTSPPPGGADSLSSTYFATPVQTVKFEGTAPAGWTRIGSLPLDFSRAMRPANGGSKNTVGGGIYWATSISPDQPTAFEAAVRVNRPADEISVQVFVTDTPDFSADRGSSSHELVWQSKGPTSQVFLPSGLSEGTVDRNKDVKDRTVRITFNRDQAMVDLNGQRLWSGPSQLAADKPRYVGVRILRTGGDHNDAAVVTGVKVLKP